jgi:hypothetical protein
MRASAVLFSSCLLLLAVLCGCPARQRDGAEGAPAAGTGAASGIPPAAEPTAGLPPSAPYGEFSLDGLRLGVNYDKWAERISPRQYEINYEWAEKGLTGRAFTVRRDGQRLRDEIAFFLAGRLVSLNMMRVQGQEAFDERVKELDAQYGASTDEPPAWARNSWYFAGYEGPVAWFDTRIWQDEPHRTVLTAGHDRGGEWSSHTLFNVDDLAAVLTALAAGLPEDELEIGGETDAADGAADQAETPAVPLDDAWQLAGFRLGTSVDEISAGLPSGEEWSIEQHWRVEQHTGVIIIRNGSEAGGMQGSLMFLEGELIAVLKYAGETYDDFGTHFEGLRMVLGEPRADTPEFAQGRAFIAEMLADERRPDVQYLWGEPEREWLLIAGYDYEDKLASYMLIAADKYDQLAAEMEHLR